MKLLARYITLTLLLLLGCLGMDAQREQNNIYLFDSTGSMKGNGLWNPARQALEATIEMQRTIPGSGFCVIPFGDEPYEVISFDGAGYPDVKARIDKAFDTYVRQAKYTHITDALNAGFDRCDSHRENNIYLLTDGMPNGGDTPEKVAEAITRWCAAHRNSRLFYVALTNGVINPVIQSAIDACPDAFVVQCEQKVIPIIAHISTDVYTNIEELSQPRALQFSLAGSHSIAVESADSLIDVRATTAADGKINLTFAARGGRSTADLHAALQGREHEFGALVHFTDPRFVIANPEITVHVADEVPTSLELCDALSEVRAESVRWYDSFLWSAAAPEIVVAWDLAPIFRNAMPQSAVKLRLDAGGATDFTAAFNGQPLSDGAEFTVLPGTPAVIELMFEHDAATGKRYFTLVPVRVTGVDLINGQPADDYSGTTLRTAYDVDWNPLKTLLFWIAVVLLSALVLWLVILRRIFFPPIAVGKVEMTGPGSYYVSKKIKGARRVVFTSKRRSQNILSRLFTGEIRYVRADHFTPEITIEAAAGKKKVKVRSAATPSGGWDIYPSTTFRTYEKGTATNRANREKIELEFS